MGDADNKMKLLSSAKQKEESANEEERDISE